MTTKKVSKRPRKGTKKKFFGIWFTYIPGYPDANKGIWANDYIPFLKFRQKSE